MDYIFDNAFQEWQNESANQISLSDLSMHSPLLKNARSLIFYRDFISCSFTFHILFGLLFHFFNRTYISLFHLDSYFSVFLFFSFSFFLFILSWSHIGFLPTFFSKILILLLCKTSSSYLYSYVNSNPVISNVEKIDRFPISTLRYFVSGLLSCSLDIFWQIDSFWQIDIFI